MKWVATSFQTHYIEIVKRQTEKNEKTAHIDNKKWTEKSCFFVSSHNKCEAECPFKLCSHENVVVVAGVDFIETKVV